jgi:prepilin-type N-terminal cleavage/methylation domain-containing protein
MILFFSDVGKHILKRRGFTLIELLIVIAIILILIAIALPNFLEAQERARVTRAKGNLRTMETAMNNHFIDYGCIPADFNDGAQITLKCRTRLRVGGPCSPTRGCNWGSSRGGLTFQDVDRCAFYALNMHCPLTTPMKYMKANETLDPWGDGLVPIGFDSREINNKIIYGAFWAAGPDKVAGDWLRFGRTAQDANKDGCTEALPYSPTNGTTSRGELWGVVTDSWSKSWGSYCESARAEYVIQRTY